MAKWRIAVVFEVEASSEQEAWECGEAIATALPEIEVGSPTYAGTATRHTYELEDTLGEIQ